MVITAHTKKFADQELHVQIDYDLHNQDVAILQSTSKPVNDHLMELLLIADTAKRAGARRIIAIIPYFGYSRQDRPSYNLGPISASLVATLIEASGVDRVITIDLHSRQSEGFFKIRVQNLDPLLLFTPLFKGINNCTVVSPDIGGLPRAQKLTGCLGVDLAVINKSRKQDGECIMSEVIGDVADKSCVLVDDIVDTGETLCQAATLLRQKGARSVSACVTHAVLSGECISRIERSSFDKFYITDTINALPLPDKIQVITISGIISDALKR